MPLAVSIVPTEWCIRVTEVSQCHNVSHSVTQCETHFSHVICVTPQCHVIRGMI
jgi:hypothetical protein